MITSSRAWGFVAIIPQSHEKKKLRPPPSSFLECLRSFAYERDRCLEQANRNRSPSHPRNFFNHGYRYIQCSLGTSRFDYRSSAISRIFKEFPEMGAGNEEEERKKAAILRTGVLSSLQFPCDSTSVSGLTRLAIRQHPRS